MQQLKLFGALMLSMVCVATAQADESKEHALRAAVAWSAFECSSLASMSKDAAEQERLFLYGLEQGRRFIAAHQAGKIKHEHLSNTVPLRFLLLLEGPSTDFMLGRIFEAIQENAVEDIFKTGDKFNSKEVQVILAQTKFGKRNCELIGK